MNAPGYDRLIWKSSDGHRHVSVSIGGWDLRWKRQKNGDLMATTPREGDFYVIKREPYVGLRFTYTVRRAGHPISRPHSRLKDAKRAALINAEGREVVNVA